MKVLLISPPFTQLNSPYASLPFLQGSLKANGIDVSCLDLGIRISCGLFSSQTAVQVLDFLRGKDDRLAEKVLSCTFLPDGKMLRTALDKNTAKMSDTDYAKYLCSLYLEDIFLDYNKICPDYELSRYGEKIALSLPSFEIIRKKIISGNDLISDMIEEELKSASIESFDIIALTVPFPGTLTGALKAAQFIKKNYPDKIIVLGGGYVNTELRSLTDPGIFDYADFICLDDGEIPMLRICSYAEGKIGRNGLVRTFYCDENKVVYADNSHLTIGIIRGTPDYSGLEMDKYIPVYESVNPMMRLWSEKDTLKLRLAKGCYWHKCGFCDTSLPYIKDFAPESVDDIINDITAMTGQTGLTRFHFVDEALPPALVIKLSLELLRRGIMITWWGNIRFDKAFTEDVCRLLKAAGCIAAVGGLESASDRTLKRMNKGVTVAEAVKVMRNFSSAGILVHAYMICGFPGETDRDLIDSAEALRQMFAAGILNSAYWHRFALSVHSPVYAHAEEYGLSVSGRNNPFANNGVEYTDSSGNDPDKFADGLRKSVYNWMLGICLDNDIRTWFGFPVPEPKAGKNFVRNILNSPSPLPGMNKRIVWLGKEIRLKGKITVIEGLNGDTEYELPQKIALWLKELADEANVKNAEGVKLSDAEKSFPDNSGIKFTHFICNAVWDDLFDAGMLII